MKYERYPLQSVVCRYQKKMKGKGDVTVCKSPFKVAVTVFFFSEINIGRCVSFHMLLNNYCFIDRHRIDYGISWMCICQ